MPERRKQPPSPSPAPVRGGGIARTLGPAVPLAIALAHGALTGPPSVAPEHRPPQPPSSGQIMSAIAPCGGGTTAPCTAPVPMLAKGQPVDWWFVFKFNVAKFPGCGGASIACPFGGQPMRQTGGLQYAYATSQQPTLQQGAGDCLGDATSDPVGATFDEVYNGNFHYVIWNDQFYGNPKSASCGDDQCGAPWGHSKGILAWNDAGEGLVMQVSTPSWPGSGSPLHPRLPNGNTLGCVTDDNVRASQHFFALRLSHEDVDTVLDALANASVVTDPKEPQIVSNGGPADIQAKVNALGVKSKNASLVEGVLTSGVEIISKPSAMNVPPWQMVSSELGGVSLRTATWWAHPAIPSTTGGVPGCWDHSLTTPPGAVDIATSGTWNGVAFSLKGGISPDANHAKLGVSTSGADHFVIFGDMNQQGSLSGDCSSSQNGRGGMFFVMNNQPLSASVASLIAGASASPSGASEAPQ